MLSNGNDRRACFAWIIPWTATSAKLDVSETEAFIVTLAEALGPVYDPLPAPFQPPKEYPELGVALIGTSWPLLYQLLAGATVPPAPAFMTRKYCVLKLAVTVESLTGVTV